MSTSITYIEEELPEITVREIVTGEEEILEEGNKIGVNIHGETEIMDQLLLLLQKLKHESAISLQRKAEAMADIHREVIKPKMFELSQSMVPKVQVQRLDVSDKEASFLQSYDDIQNIQNYHVRREGFKKLFFTFESTNQTDPPQWSPKELAHPVELLTEDKAVLLPEDNLSSKIDSIKVYQGIASSDPAFEKYTLTDKIQSTLKPWKEMILESDNLEGFIKQFLDKEWKESFEWHQEITDLYTLWKQFMLYGIDIETFTEQQWSEWIEHLQKLQKKDKELFEFLKPLEYVPQALDIPEAGAYTFYLIHKEIIQKLGPVLQVLQEQLLNLYRVYLEAVPHYAIQTANMPKTLYEIAMAIYEQSSDMTTVIDLLKAAVLKERLLDLEKWMASVQQWNAEKIQEAVDRELQRYERTKSSIYDEFHRPLNSLKAELKSIKKGEVIAPEINENEHRADEVFEATEDFVLEDSDPNEIEIQVYDDSLPISLTHLDDSLRELYEITLRMVIELQKGSGLPLDVEKIHAQIPHPLRLSKLSLLKSLLPEMSEEMLVTLTQFNDIQSFIEATIEPVNYTPVKQALETMRKEFNKDVFQYMSQFIAIWVAELQQSVLNRALRFEVWQGSVECIQSWSPYGMPMEGLKDKREGIMPYVWCVLHELSMTQGTLWNKYGISFTKEQWLESWIHLYENSLKLVATNLQEQFKHFEKDIVHRNLLEKGNDIKNKIIETVEQRNKNRYLMDYMNFLKHLPSVLIQSSVAKKIHIGCCLQNLSEKYHSDYDWSSLVKQAYRIKKLYATQRFGTDKRPSLTKIIRDLEIVESKIYELPYDKIQYDVQTPLKVMDMYDDLKPFMPIKDHQALVSGIRNLIPLTEKYIATYIHTLGFKVGDFEATLTETLSLQELIQLYRKILQVQYLNIQIAKDYPEFLLAKWKELEPLYPILLNIQGFFNDVQEQNAKRLFQYFIIRQLCFPAKPEYAIANTLTLMDATVSANLVKNFNTLVYREIEKWLEMKVFQKRTNFIEYLSKQREQENLEKLQLVDQMNPEERKLYVEAKKLGILEIKDYLAQFKERMEEHELYEETDDVVDREGEDETYPKRGENDDEINPDEFYDDDY